MNIDDLFSALSNNDKSQELETNCSDVNSEKESADDDDSHDQILQRSPVKHTNLKKKDAADHGNDDDVNGGESSQVSGQAIYISSNPLTLIVLSRFQSR